MLDETNNHSLAPKNNLQPPLNFLVGVVVGWSYYAREEGGDLRLGVVRPVSSDPTTDCQFIVVGITSLTNGEHYNKLNLVTLNETISVQAGDYHCYDIRKR